MSPFLKAFRADVKIAQTAGIAMVTNQIEASPTDIANT
jgi:hypothetical protein